MEHLPCSFTESCATGITPAAVPWPLPGSLKPLQELSPCDSKSRLVLRVPGASNPEPFPGNCQAFLHTLQSTKLLYINTLGRSCPRNMQHHLAPAALGSLRQRTTAPALWARSPCRCSWELQVQLSVFVAETVLRCWLWGALSAPSSFRIPNVPARPTYSILIAAVLLSTALVSSQSHNSKLEPIEFRYN